MQAPLQARFRDLPTVDMKEILQQRMFKENSYQAHDVHNDLYKALQKSLELDYTNQRLADQEEASGVFGTHTLSLTDYLMQDDSIPKEQVLLSDDEDSKND
ncbi:hypothetical protein Tco_0315427, partial [Tanacetum coccineum]